MYAAISLSNFFQTILLISTATSVRKQIISSKKRLGKQSNDSNQDLFSKEEVAAFKTVSLMQLGFTVTLGIYTLFLYLLVSSK